jgi:hypothetical protein
MEKNGLSYESNKKEFLVIVIYPLHTCIRHVCVYILIVTYLLLPLGYRSVVECLPNMCEVLGLIRSKHRHMHKQDFKNWKTQNIPWSGAM